MEFVTVLSVVACGSVAALVAAIGACALRRWHFAAIVSRAVVLVGPILLLVSVVAFTVLPLRTRAGDPSMKAIVLTEGVSEVMNTGGVACLTAIPCSLIWRLARRRLPAAGRENAG
jgi:hypothetical protein